MRDRETLSLSLSFSYREGDDGTDIREPDASIGSREGSGLISEHHGRKPKNDPAVFALNRIEIDLKIGGLS